jgi:OFA family oxalate/formate antiporter-like MFS transporter
MQRLLQLLFTDTEKKRVKTRRSSIVPIIGCLVIQICVGILYLWSIFKTPIMNSFDWSKESATMVSSYMLFAFVTGNLIGGLINDKKGPRLTAITGIVMFSAGVSLTGLLTKDTINWMNLTYCVLGGLGSGIAYGACISCIQKWLPHRKGLASGLAVSAFAFSTVLFTPISQALMTANTVNGVVNFRPVFLTLAAVFFVVGIIGTIFIKLPTAEYFRSFHDAPASEKIFTGRNFTLYEAMKKPVFWLIFIELLFINGTWTLSIPLIKNLGMQRGLTEDTAILIVSLTGIFNAAGRLIMAAVSDKIGRVSTIIILSVLTFIGAILMILNVPVAGFIIAICIIAFGYGGPASTNAALVTDFFGPKNSGTNYGVVMLALGFSSVLFNTISSYFLNGDITKTYIMAAASAIVPIIMMIIINSRMKKVRTEAVSLSETLS